jgi:hypothetical protein
MLHWFCAQYGQWKEGQAALTKPTPQAMTKSDASILSGRQSSMDFLLADQATPKQLLLNIDSLQPHTELSLRLPAPGASKPLCYLSLVICGAHVWRWYSVTYFVYRTNVPIRMNWHILIETVFSICPSVFCPAPCKRCMGDEQQPTQFFCSNVCHT